MIDKTNALATTSGGEMEAPSPVYKGQAMIKALGEYKTLQKALDEAMPDQLMRIGDKVFRKKGYWRAVATAFNLDAMPLTTAQEERSVIGTLEDGSENYVYTVTYRATAPNGRSITGDGTCAASEKQKGRMEATEHNVRSHAHTRAFNRAISNLVGFGEVSAEEADASEHAPGERQQHSQSGGQPTMSSDGTPAKVTVKTVYEVKEADKPGGTNKPGKVILSDGREGTTFDKKIIEFAQAAKVSGEAVEAKFDTVEKNGRKFVNIMGLEPVKVEEAKLPLEPDAEPVGQPEKILSILPKKTASGQEFWEINSDRRIYVTTNKVIADTLEESRKDKKTVIIAFEPLKGKDKVFNQITNLTDPPAASDVKDGEVVAEAKASETKEDPAAAFAGK